MHHVCCSLFLSPANTIIICRAVPLAASALLFHIGFPPATLLLASPVIICSSKNALYPLLVHTQGEPRHLITHWKLISHYVFCTLTETFSPRLLLPREYHAWRASFYTISIHLIELCYMRQSVLSFSSWYKSIEARISRVYHLSTYFNLNCTTQKIE